MTNILDRGRSALQAWEFIPACVVGGIHILDIYNYGKYFCKGTHWNCLDDIYLHPHTFPVLLEGGRGLVTYAHIHTVYMSVCHKVKIRT
jgi:hypothetical protein